MNLLRLPVFAREAVEPFAAFENARLGGGTARDRTFDLLIFGQPLFQLSYRTKRREPPLGFEPRTDALQERCTSQLC